MMKKIVDYCVNENNKNINLILPDYKARLNNYIKDSLYKPICYNLDYKTVNGKWINPNSIILESGFKFYHHSPDNILDHSIEKRGDFEYLINQMNPENSSDILHIREYPSPFFDDKLYMVKGNGNHRTGVFRTIGLPIVTASIEEPLSSQWIYYTDSFGCMVKKLFKFLKKIDMLEKFDIQYDRCLFTPKSDLAIWILPDVESGSIIEIVSKIQTRIRLLDNLFPNQSNQIPEKLRSKLLWLYILIE